MLMMQKNEKQQTRLLDSKNASLFSFPSFLYMTRLVVDGLAVGSHGSLLESLSKSRVSVRGSGNILR